MVKNNNRTGSVTDNAATSPSSCTRGKSGLPNIILKYKNCLLLSVFLVHFQSSATEMFLF